MRHRLAEAKAVAEEHRSEQVDADVAVPELEPGLLTKASEHRLRVEGVVANAEARRLIEDTGQPVQDGVDIRADQQTPELVVVSGVGDNREVTRRQLFRKPEGRTSSCPDPGPAPRSPSPSTTTTGTRLVLPITSSAAAASSSATATTVACNGMPKSSGCPR
jgi:hypothetical protein